MKKKTELKTNIEWLKDIEWLKREIKEINPYTLHTSTLQKKMLELIDQLDKPETLSQKWIDEHKQHITRHSADKDDIGQYHNPPVVSVYDLQNLLVPKQEEIGVPEWFAEWFEGRGYQMSLYGIFNDLYTNSKSKMEEWSKKYEMGHAELQNDIASIKLHGKGVYEVEEEQKFYVDLNTAAYVAKWNGDGSVRIYTDSVSGSDEYELLLTEQEIKGYDERFWPFAKPIEEVEKNGEN